VRDNFEFPIPRPRKRIFEEAFLREFGEKFLLLGIPEV
jgi:hypothetical protein